jgi:HD-GYP domain-containing protein (c-di-GMP phosphodiesterase class II)
VTVLGLLIARRMWERDGWTDFRGKVRRDRIEDRLRKLGLGLLVHDVGKLAVPPEILNKPGALTDDEMAVMRTHPEAGVELLRSASISPLILSVVRDHHERPDGRGYPAGLRGDEIPVPANIIHVADALDAITTTRVYRGAVGLFQALDRIRAGSGTDFDAGCVQALERAVEKGVIVPPGQIDASVAA